MSSALVRIAERVVNRPLMIEPGKLAVIASILDGRIGIDASGLSPDASRFVGTREKDGDGRRKAYRTEGGVAIIEISGSLVNRFSYLDALSGLTSYEEIKHLIGMAAADPDVSAILLDIDSPGGEAIGAFEAADAVRAAAAQKPVTAVVNGMAASAAYAIASAATTIVTTASGVSGSIGVVLLHTDISQKLHSEGIRPTLIHAGARKIDGNPYQPLTDDVRTELKGEVDRFYDLFVDTVVAGRSGLKSDAVRATEARTYLGADAVKKGLADRVGSFESALAELSQGRARRGYLSGSSAARSSRSQAGLDDPGVGLTAAALRLFGRSDADAMARSPGAEPQDQAHEDATLRFLPPAQNTVGLDATVARLVAQQAPPSLTAGHANFAHEPRAPSERRSTPSELMAPARVGAGLAAAVDNLIARDYPNARPSEPMPIGAGPVSGAPGVLGVRSRRS